MFDALLMGFDVAVKHSGVGMKSDLVRGARDIEPLLAADLVIANHFANAWIENLRASAGQGIHSRVFQGEQRIANGKLGDSREIADLDHGESLQVHARATRL